MILALEERLPIYVFLKVAPNSVMCFYLGRLCLKPDGGEDTAESCLVKKRGQLALGADGWRVVGERGPCHQGVAS